MNLDSIHLLTHPLKLVFPIKFPTLKTKTKTNFNSKLMATNHSQLNYDRTQEVNQFESTKLGVKGLVDSGITQIPRIFHHPPETLIKPTSEPDPDEDSIPVIDLSDPHPNLVDQVRAASSKFGFFQVVNHGVPVSFLDRLVGATRRFHDLPAVEKERFYKREMKDGVSFFSNVDLFVSKAASWRDTLQFRLGPVAPESSAIPDVCRDEVIEWNNEVTQLGERLLELLSEGLGLSGDKLKDMSFSEGRVMVAHYYPQCPEPDKTVGLASHSDPGVLTVLLQDHVGGLQIKYGDKWINVKPVHGALVINVGDLLQMISNDEYTSVEHRVFANHSHEARVSIAVFFDPSKKETLLGPLSELVTSEKPALYRDFTYVDVLKRFFTKGLDNKSLPNYFRLQNE